MKICSVVGTRPNFVKEFLVNRELRRRGIKEVLIHTGQHYDYEMSQAFFDCFDLPAPDVHLQLANTNEIEFSARAILELAAVFQAERPTCVLSYGDVNSTLAAAIAASKLRVPFAHVEGGIRAHDWRNPEEINRRVSDMLADVIFCCTESNVRNLQNEGFENSRIELAGDLMKDALLVTLDTHQIVPARGDYLVMTLHRQETLAEEGTIRAILEGVIQADLRTVFPAHPRTLKMLEKYQLLPLIAQSRIELCKPLGYVDFVRLAAGADKVLTDSGGVRREAYLLRKPCIVLSDLSWFPEISEAGWKIRVGADSQRIAHLIRTFEPTGPHRGLFGDGYAHRKIVDVLEARCMGNQYASRC